MAVAKIRRFSISSANRACRPSLEIPQEVFKFLPFDLVDNVAGMIHSKKNMFLLGTRKKEEEKRMNISFTRLQIFS